MNYLVLVRHGQSEWNEKNLFTGFKDVELTQKGIDEAKQAGKDLQKLGVSFDRVYTSTLKRAIETTDYVLEESGQADLKGQVIQHPDLRERDYGDLTGLNKDETRDKYGEEQFKIWRRGYDTPPPGGECLKDVVENRVKPYYTTEIKQYVDAGENILIGAHGNSLRAMLIVLGVETPDTINQAEMPTGKPLVFEFENGEIQKYYFIDEQASAA